MVRTQIQLTEDQAERAKREANRMGVSMAEFIRRALDDALESPRNQSSIRRKALSVIGCVASGTGDISLNHDRYLEDAYAE